jgi:hypothetical protein
MLLEFPSLATSAQIGTWPCCSSSVTSLNSFQLYRKHAVYTPPLPPFCQKLLRDIADIAVGTLTPAMLTNVWSEPEYRDVTGYSQSIVKCRPQKTSAYDLPKYSKTLFKTFLKIPRKFDFLSRKCLKRVGPKNSIFLIFLCTYHIHTTNLYNLQLSKHIFTCIWPSNRFVCNLSFTVLFKPLIILSLTFHSQVHISLQMFIFS